MTEPPDHHDEAEIGALEGEIPSPAITLEQAEALGDAEGTIRSGKLAGRSLRAGIWILAMPVLVQQLAAAFLGLVDKILAGNLPAEIVVPALDGLGIASYVGWFVGIAMTGLGIGGQAIIARAIGAGDLAEAKRGLGQAIALSVVWGFVVGLGMWALAPLVAALCGLGAPADAFCVGYIRILACGMPFCGVMMVGSMCLHGAGETTKPAVIAVGINVVNIGFSWMLSGADIAIGSLSITNPFSFDLWVNGIAIGTALSYLVGAVLIIAVLVRGVKDLHLERPELSLDRSMAPRIVRIGVPSFLEGISMWTVNLLVLILIGHLADDGLQGAHIIAVQWEAFSFLPGFAIGTAAGALAGQYLGAGNPRMARRAVVVCTAMACVVMGLLGVVFMVAGTPLTKVISTEAIHLEMVPKLLFIAGVTQVFFAITMVVRQGLRGVGDTKWTLFITTVSSYGVRLPAAWLLGIVFGLGLPGIWLGLCGEFLVRAALFTARFLHGGWSRVRV